MGLFCAVIPLLPGDWPLLLFNGRLPMISISAALFMPVGMTLFFRTAPAGREGFFYGLVMTLGELLWVALFPLLGGGFDDLTASPGRAFHLFTLHCLTMGVTGLCLGTAFYLRDAPKTNMNGPAVSKETRAALLWIFGAGMGVFILMGLEMGMILPKAALAPGLITLPHFIPLFFLPVAGRMLDGEKPGRLMLLLVPACLSLPFLVPAQANGLLDPLALFCLLSVTRQTLLLAVLTVCARLMKTHNLLPLLLTLAHCLHLMQAVGALPRGLLAVFPYGVFAVALFLAVGTVCCLWSFRSLLIRKPKLWALPQEKVASMPEAGLPMEVDPGRLAAFAKNYGLSRQEFSVMAMLVEGRSTDDIAKVMNVAESTVRKYVSRMLQKTAVPNRVALMALFAAQNPAIAGTAEHDKSGSR
jgi:DNA-binding CsgD family transcriptional regulator